MEWGKDGQNREVAGKGREHNRHEKGTGSTVAVAATALPIPGLDPSSHIYMDLYQ